MTTKNPRKPYIPFEGIIRKLHCSICGKQDNKVDIIKLYYQRNGSCIEILACEACSAKNRLEFNGRIVFNRCTKCKRLVCTCIAYYRPFAHPWYYDSLNQGYCGKCFEKEYGFIPE